MNNSFAGLRSLLQRKNVIDGTAGADTLTDTSGDDLLRGLAGRDTLYGSQGHDTLLGGGGRDFLYDTTGGDLLDGGAGNDLLVGNTGSTLRGGLGNDVLRYASSWGGNSLMDGGDGNDLLRGSTGGETLLGGSGDDVIQGRRSDSDYVASGADFIDGGDGNDRVQHINTHQATLLGGLGEDTLEAIWTTGIDIQWTIDTPQTQTVAGYTVGGFEHLRLRLGSGDDVVHGGNATSLRLEGDWGDDWFQGGSSNDTLMGDQGSDTLLGGDGDDFLHGGNGSSIAGVVWRDWLDGQAGNDHLYGGAGSTLVGGMGQDTLVSDGTDVTIVLDNLNGPDAIFVYGSNGNQTPTLCIDAIGLPIGNGDTVIDGATSVSGPGGFDSHAELVILSSSLGGLGTPSAEAAAAAIGHAETSYAVGQTALFVVHTDNTTAIYHFSSDGNDATISSNELSLLATMQGNPNACQTSDFVFA